MIPLAFNFDGEAFELPPTAVGWRVKRLRQGKGAPELVYGADGVPLVVPLETDIEELRRIVVAPGKYRLDPVDDQHRVIKSADVAYVCVRASDSEPVKAETVLDNGPTANAVLMEAMRQNSEMARSIVDRFPAMLEASAVLLRAADGAGLPMRKPLLEERDDDDDDDEPVSPTAGFDLNAMIAALVPVLVTSFAKGDIKLPDLAEMLDWRRAARKKSSGGGATKPQPSESSAKPEPSAAAGANGTSTPAGANETSAPASAQAATDAELPPLSPQAMVHFMAIQAALTPEEAALARAAASELSPTDLRAWFDQLSSLSVPEAVARVRALLAASKTEAA
jgi:hypothetical protein